MSPDSGNRRKAVFFLLDKLSVEFVLRLWDTFRALILTRYGNSKMNTKTMSVSNAEKRLRKALAIITDVSNRISEDNHEIMGEALNAAYDFIENAINKTMMIRGVNQNDK